MTTSPSPAWTEIDPTSTPFDPATGLCPAPDQTNPHPTCRVYAAMAYDPVHNNVVLYGGEAPRPVADTTWIWNGTSWRQPLPQTSAPPPPVSGAALAFDGSHIMAFGGRTDSSQSGDTWLWDGGTETWAQVSFPPGAPTPPARQWAGVAYDNAAHQVVLYGGVNVRAGELGDTWTWDGLAKTWTQTDLGAGPPNREAPAMAYDAAHKSVVLFGGTCSGKPACAAQTYFTDTWTHTAAGWTLKDKRKVDTAGACPLPGSPATTGLPAIDSAAMAYDAASGTIVMFGGQGPSQLDTVPPSLPQDQDTWIWDGSTPDGLWSLLDACSGSGSLPPGRNGAAMATNPGVAGQQRLVLFGGSHPNRNDTWIWTSTAPPPPPTTTTTTTAPPAPTTTTTTMLVPAPRPVVRAVMPVSGPVNGGTPVTIAGTGLDRPRSVDFGDVRLDCTQANTCAVQANGDLHVTSPAHAAGPVVVVVTAAAGASDPTPDPTVNEFTYFAPTTPSNPAVFGSSASVQGPSQPGQPAPPGGFGSAPAPGGFSSAPAPGGFSSAPAPGGFSSAPAPGAPAGGSTAPPEVGSGLPPPVASALAPGIAQPGAAGPVPGFMPPVAAPPTPAFGVPPDPVASPAPHFNMTRAAPQNDRGLTPNPLPLAAATGVVFCCSAYARRRPAGPWAVGWRSPAVQRG